jgi:hypothetical protein
VFENDQKKHNQMREISNILYHYAAVNERLSKRMKCICFYDSDCSIGNKL